ncbi:MAG: redoxin domain-containing protein [Alphaproteobacteria bacterium]|nr:redoxin domain-containing protein [Alphaproteobacteria bacterium]
MNCCSPHNHDHSEKAMVGAKVPEMAFQVFHDGDIKDVSTKKYKGKWLVVFFYPADFTFVCPTELGELAHFYKDFKKEGVEILSASTDTAFAHKMWHDTSETIKTIEFPMAADNKHILTNYFNVWNEEEGMCNRGTFLIDPDGIIKAIEIHDNSIGRSAKELLRKVRAAKFVASHPGNVCPAGWDVGDDTLKPGTKLIGKI